MLRLPKRNNDWGERAIVKTITEGEREKPEGREERKRGTQIRDRSPCAQGLLRKIIIKTQERITKKEEERNRSRGEKVATSQGRACRSTFKESRNGD